jgi:hypothetical protein
MRLPISRYGIVVALALCSLCCSTGCRSGGWGMPAANSNWLSWKNWGWNKSAGEDAAALASKPTTTAPKPSSTATPQPTTSIAAGTGVGGSSTAASTASTASATYPTTSQGFASSYATQPAAAYQQAGATGQVQPSGGYQTGPYNVNTTAAAGYGQPAAGGSYTQDPSGGYAAPQNTAPNYGGQGYAASGYTAQNQAAGSYAAAAPTGDYRTADNRGMYGVQDASPYSNDQQQGGYGAGSYNGGGYGTGTYGSGSQPATGGYSAPAAGGATPQPTTTNPWNSYQAPQPSTYGAATQPTGGYAAAPAQPAPATAGYPALPANLATSGSSYRPGSTAAAGEGVQNAAYTQPAANSPAASGSINYGNSYLR